MDEQIVNSGEVSAQSSLKTSPFIIDTPVQDNTTIVTNTTDTVIPQTQIDWSVINQAAGTNFNSIDDVISFKAEKEKLSNYEQELQVRNQELNAFKEVVNTLNPNEYFPDEQTMKAALYMKNNPTKDSSTVNKLFTNNIDELNNYDAIKLLYGVTYNLEGGEEGIAATVNRKFGIDPLLEVNEWDLGLKNDIAIAGLEAKEKLKQIVNGIEIPKVNIPNLENVNQFEADRVNRFKETAMPLINAFANTISAVPLQVDGHKDGIPYEYDPQYKQQIPELVANYLYDIRKGVVNENTLKDAKEYVEGIYLIQNMPKVLRTIEEGAYNKAKSTMNQQVYNPSTRQDKINPDVKQGIQTIAEFIKS